MSLGVYCVLLAAANGVALAEKPVVPRRTLPRTTCIVASKPAEQSLTPSGWWGSLGVSALLAVGPIRRVGVPALLRLKGATLTPVQTAAGLGIFAFFAISRAQLLVKNVAPKVVARASRLSSSSPLYQRALAPLCGLGILPISKANTKFLCALPFIIFTARLGYGALPLLYRDIVFCSAMFGGLTPFAGSIAYHAVRTTLSD